MEKRQWLMSSEIGPIYLVASEKHLHGILWKKQSVPMLESIKRSDPFGAVFRETAKQIEEYLSGKRRAFDLPIKADGTDFQRSVWAELRKVPYGQKISYRDLARRIKNDRAVRAVGTANGRNPLSIVVPCHRVIGSDGELCGYAGGLEIKRKLLAIEASG